MLTTCDTQGDAVIFRKKVFANDILPSVSLVILNTDNVSFEENVASLIDWHSSHFK